ncbi:hypothetical protein ACFXK0_11640 [Nocardia sp. NPDC059177]|uniref:hypothetical protein n=1 Tax=Nocardia sp. NPDC059177 TaxID=3346759 RepID=UPI0036C78988
MTLVGDTSGLVAAYLIRPDSSEMPRSHTIIDELMRLRQIVVGQIEFGHQLIHSVIRRPLHVVGQIRHQALPADVVPTDTR